MIDKYGLDSYPWERLEQETSLAYAAFICYRDQGKRRTLRQTVILHYEQNADEYDANGGKKRTVNRWSTDNHWVKRCEAYDDYMQNLADAEDIEQIKAMRKRHVNLTTVVQAKVVDYLNGITKDQLSRMSPDQAMRMLDLAIKNERLARGVPDSITGLTNKNGDPVEVETISDDALVRKLEAYLMASDPKNDIERGEPPAPADEVSTAESWAELIVDKEGGKDAGDEIRDPE